MVHLKHETVVLLVVLSLHGASAQGIFDPCYFWPGAVYVGSGRCFLYVESPLTFQDAQTACQADGATLAEVRSTQHRDVVSSVMTSGSGSTAAWLGATSLDGNFQWVSDSDLVLLPLDWWSGSVIPQVNSSDALCLVMTTQSTLDAQTCGEKFGYICQIYAGSPCDTFLPGAEYFNNQCFLPLVKEVSFGGAVEQCQNRHGFVVEPITLELITFVNKLAHWYLDATKSTWLGLAWNSTTTDLTWRTSGDLVLVSNWPGAGSGVPANVTLTSDDAVVMGGAEAWSWRVDSRSSLAQVICQRDLSLECTGLFVEGKCLVYHDELKKWSDARADCLKSNGFYLAEPNTELLGRSVDRYLNGLSDLVYLGGQAIDTPGTFIWDHSREKMDDGFTNWNLNEPNNSGGKENVLIWRRDLKWNDVAKNRTFSYLCETVFDPVYVHSYVVVMPKEAWAGPLLLTQAMLSVSTQPDHDTHNSIEISTYPTGQQETRTLSKDEAFQYNINVTGIALNSTGVQYKYILVRSQAPLDVLFLYRGKTLYMSIMLVLESLPDGEPSSFFSHPSLLYNTLGFVNTDVTSTTVKLALSTNNETVSFAFNGNEVSTRDNLQISTSLPDQYHSLYVDSLSGATTSASVHSTGSLNVFHYGIEDRPTSRDTTMDQVLPVSLLGRDYVTFPSLPFNSKVTDFYTVVAVYSNTVISVFHPSTSKILREVTLLWPGDSTQLELLATGFHHVTGTGPFYLYAKFTGTDPTSPGKSGRCSVTLLHEGLYRTSYRLPVVGPMTDVSDMFVVVVVRTPDSGSLELVSPDGSRHKADRCQVVSAAATQWSGCYFEVTNRTPGAVYRVKMTSVSPSKFAAYLFARVPKPEKLLCFQLGLPEMSSLNMSEQYDVTSYSSIINLKPLWCDVTEPTTSSPPPDVTQCPVIVNTTEVTLTSAELEEALEQITTHLTVEKSSLSSVKRTKESAPDERASSTSMGYFSLTFIGVFLGLMIVSDFGRLFLDLKLAISNIRTLR